eukprot:CAMPEP_0197437794 /NCGR_PEP_ID=MMETSP1175-20131217/4947_1 /TAXON_ID=1003142 /ORGANISM="Triceratium dubium, Strain CCMP147" /LENGTH=689 /DNA_ID=CAMNT_0042967405 /DNA_START=13 /DNA_END=2082 /DNA_ORIENTATION=-
MSNNSDVEETETSAREAGDSYSPPLVYTESDFLQDVLAGEMSLTPSKLLALDDAIVLKYSLLIASLIGYLGSVSSAPNSSDGNGGGTPAAIKRHSSDTSPHFLSLLRAFSVKCMSSRPLKLRFSLLLNVAGLDVLKSSLRPVVAFDPECYDRPMDLTEGPSSESDGAQGDQDDTAEATEKTEQLSIVSVKADDLLQSDELLRDYAERRFFSGIEIKTRKRHGLKTYANAFSEYSALLFLMQDLKVSQKGVASAIGARMVELGIIKRVSTLSHLMEGGGGSSAFGFGKGVYVQSEAAKPTVPVTQKDKDGDGRNETGPTADLVFGADVVDMQSLTFWQNALFANTLVEGSDFGTYSVVHPMATIDSGAGHGNSRGGRVVHRVDVKKVFNSMAKPGIIALSSYPTGAVLMPQDRDGAVEVLPRMIAKTGDNLLQDLSVSISFRIMNHIWNTDARFGGTEGKAPLSFAYDVLPTGPRVGLLEVVSGLSSLNDYDWVSWTAKYASNKKALDSMVRSAAGCSIAQYILGCGDRHFDNIQIKDGDTLLHIDFGMILGENPAFKTPRFSISADMEKAFRDVSIWEPFVDMCGEAFLSLRSRSAELMRLVALVLRHAGRPKTRILKYLASNQSLNIAEEDDKKAAKFVCDQVRSSSRNWELVLRKFTHNKVDPLFFKAVEKAPAGLVTAVEKLYDKP